MRIHYSDYWKAIYDYATGEETRRKDGGKFVVSELTQDEMFSLQDWLRKKGFSYDAIVDSEKLTLWIYANNREEKHEVIGSYRCWKLSCIE